jgi:hypothetical protein
MTLGNVVDLRKPRSEGTSTGVGQTVINIIEQNTGTQYNKKVLYSEIEWDLGVPVRVQKWTSLDKTDRVYDITIEWVNGVPVQVLTNNLDDGIITTTAITWQNGTPISINKVEV